MIRIIEYVAMVLLIAFGLILLYAGIAKPQGKDPCEVALDNIGAVSLTVEAAIEKAGKYPRRSSATRLAVLQAREGIGFYKAMRVLLPLACKGDRLSAIDQSLQHKTDVLQAFVDKYW